VKDKDCISKCILNSSPPSDPSLLSPFSSFRRVHHHVCRASDTSSFRNQRYNIHTKEWNENTALEFQRMKMITMAGCEGVRTEFGKLRSKFIGYRSSEFGLG